LFDSSLYQTLPFRMGSHFVLYVHRRKEKEYAARQFGNVNLISNSVIKARSYFSSGNSLLGKKTT